MISRTAKTEEGNRMDSAATTLDDDMVTEILLRLPPKSIFRFRSLSKKWNSLLTSQEFLSQCSRRFHHRQGTRSPHHLLGFFLDTHIPTTGACKIPFLSTQPRICLQNVSFHMRFLITSSNGLVLLECHQGLYHILNPVTGKHVSLPPPRNYYPALSIGLSCDEDGDDLTPRYKVVIAPLNWDIDNKLCIETYSSETKEWTESVLVATSNFKLILFCRPTVVNGVFYWFAGYDCLAVHDPHNKLGGNKDCNHLQLIQHPATPACDPYNKHVLNQTPDGSLIFGTTSDGLIKIWELPRREPGFWSETTIITKGEWVLIYQVPCGIDLELVDLITLNPLTLMVKLGRSMFMYSMESQLMKLIVNLPDTQVPEQAFFEATSFSSYLLA